MNVNTAQDRSFAHFLLRTILGLNIAIHGISRLLTGPSAFAQTLVPMFARTPLPPWSVYFFGMVLPWAEAIVGLCVLLGVGSRWAYLAGLLEIAALTFGSTLRQDWESAGLQLVYALIYSILLATRDYNTICLDRFFAQGHKDTSQALPQRSKFGPVRAG